MRKVLAIGGAVFLLLGVSTGVVFASNTRPRSMAKPVTCMPLVSNAQTRIARGLRLVRASTSKLRCGASIAVIGGASGDIWGFDYDGGLWHSSNDLGRWTRVWRGPPGSYVERALRTASGHVLIEVGYANNTHRILRSTTKTAHRFTTALVLPRDSSLHFASSWGQFSPVGAKPGTIYAGEYGDHPDPVHLWASTNDGRSFKTVFSLRGERTGAPDRARHFHGVFVDPFTKRLWVAIGDTTPEPRIGYSSDGGKSFTWITQGVYPRSRAVGLMFTKDAVYWGTDVPERPGSLYRWDRSTGAMTQVLTGLREPWFDVRQSRGWFVQFSEISTVKDDGYIGDEHVHALLGNGSSWREVTMPWTRRAAGRQFKVAPLGVTTPDRKGCFWLSLQNLAGTVEAKNIKACLGT